MPPRIRLCPQCLHPLARQKPSPTTRYLATISAITPAPPPPQTSGPPPPILLHPPTQPPSHKPPEFRKSQLHRQYTSLLRSTPLLLLFQHSNLKSTEWMSIRRELSLALRHTDAQHATAHADAIKIQAIQAGIFESALLVVEYVDPTTTTTHALSRHAHTTARPHKHTHPLTPLLSGPLALLTFPALSPPHLRAALSILAPDRLSAPAPTRRASPGYHDATTQTGLQKLLLLGARAEGRVLDGEGARWVGGLDGVEGLRGQLVNILGGLQGGLVGGLEAVGRGVWVVVEGRRGMLEMEAEAEAKAKEV